VRITNGEDGDVVFTLSREEAERVAIDHGQGELCLPCPDTIAAVIGMGAAIRGDLTDGYVIDIEELPE
jgi:hypothetical protein